MIAQLVIDDEEDTGSVEPEAADDRHEVDDVGDLVADSCKQAGDADVEDRLQSDDGNHQYDSPRQHFGWGDHHQEHNHDGDAGNEVEEIAHNGRDRQSCPGELEALDHRRTGTDCSGAPGHRSAGVLEEENTDDEVSDEVVDAFLGSEDEAEDEPEGQHGQKRVDEEPSIAEQVLSGRSADLRA